MTTRLTRRPILEVQPPTKQDYLEAAQGWRTLAAEELARGEWEVSIGRHLDGMHIFNLRARIYVETAEQLEASAAKLP